MIGALLTALKFAPTVLTAGREIVGAFTGREPPADAAPEDVAAEIEALPPDERMAATMQVMQAKTRAQELDTDRFYELTSGSAEKIRSTARPEIALRAMGVLTMFARAITVLFSAIALEWAVRALCAIAGASPPDLPSITGLVAHLEPVAELVWAPLIASFWVCADIVKKYMGCRERDKARADEMRSGKPLESARATMVDAAGSISGIIRALKGR